MTTDERVELAEGIASNLKDVSRNEWQKWLNYYAQKKDLRRAVNLAERQAMSVWLRPELKKAAEMIARVIGGGFRSQLEKLPPAELQEVFGYVGRCLKVYESEKKQSERRRFR